MAEKMKDVKQLNYHALMVLQCLFENTDQYRHLGVKDIEKAIRDKYGYGPSHNTVNVILNYLPSYGYDVRKGNRGNPGFYLNSRYFSDGEILFLIENMKKAKSMSEEDKNDFIYKLAAYLGPEYPGMNANNRVRTGKRNAELTEKISMIDRAIKSNRQLWFDITEEKQRTGGGRVQSNPYRLFERRQEVYLLYSSQGDDGEYYFSQRRVADISNLLVDPEYQAVPMYRVKYYQYINDELLSRVAFESPTVNRNRHLLVRLNGEPGAERDRFRAAIASHFNASNIAFWGQDENEYCYIRDMYGDGELWFFRHYDIATVVWPVSSVKRIRNRIARMHNLYYPENKALDDKTFISIRDAEGEGMENEEDTFDRLKEIIEKLEESRRATGEDIMKKLAEIG
ncbi:MAG: hypothetical protein K6A14_06725 [Erysipelotrichaceae bacterium]|nr:hypothetical protein [Erysipelotrichaceae bacterium]